MKKKPRPSLQYKDSSVCDEEGSRSTLDYPCMPIIDLCYGDEIANETNHPLCCKITSPPLRTTLSAIQLSANKKPKMTLSASQHQRKQCINPHICSTSLVADNIDNPCTIISPSTSNHRNICPSKNEYRTNIEKNCLNLNPYASKYKFNTVHPNDPFNPFYNICLTVFNNI